MYKKGCNFRHASVFGENEKFEWVEEDYKTQVVVWGTSGGRQV